MTPKRSGIVLLEVLVALAIMTVAIAAGVPLLRTATAASESVVSHEMRLRQADQLLSAIALWPREDLDRHLGDRRQGEWTVRVQHPTPTIYVATVLDAGVAREWMRTMVYRAP